MEYTYEVNEDGTIMRRDGLGNTACIPNDPANSDYQAYLDRDNSKAALSTPNVQVLVVHQGYGTYTTRTNSRTTT